MSLLHPVQTPLGNRAYWEFFIAVRNVFPELIDAWETTHSKGS